MKNRVFGYDLVRALAVLMVMTNHTMYLIYGLFPQFIANITMPFGDLGVVMFFVLSGYLIGDIFIKDIGSGNNFTFGMLFNFMQRRWFRTVPNYLFFFLLYVVLYKLATLKFLDLSYAYWWDSNLFINYDDQFTSMFFFCQNFFNNATSGFMGHTWSLSVEEWFYVIVPLLVFVFLKMFKLSFKYVLLSVIIGIILLSPLLRFLYFYTKLITEFNFVIVRLDQIMYGVLFAWLKNYSSYFIELQKGLWLKLGLLFLSYLVFIKLVLVQNPNIEFDIIYKSIFPLLFALLLISIEKVYWILPSFFMRFITSISIYSYSMYLCHFLVTILFTDFLFKKLALNGKVSGFVIYLLFICICFLWGKIQYRYFEKPLTKLRDKFTF